MSRVVIVSRKDLQDLPRSVRRVLLRTNGSAKAPEGWVERSGGVHMGAGRWLLPIERGDTPHG